MALQIIRNNIINVEADAIVNTANPKVAIGRGVDYAIYEAAGWDRLLEARARIGDMMPGQAAFTPAFDLAAKYVIHTVGPAWRGGSFGERETVASCYRNSLWLAKELGCESIAFPLIATGTYGFPKDEALRIAIAEISGFLLENDMEVLLVVYDRESFRVSGKLFSDVRSFIGDRDVRERRTLFDLFGGDRSENIDADHEMSAPMMPLEGSGVPWDAGKTLYDLEPVESPTRGAMSAKKGSLDERLKHLDKTFQQHLFMLIDRRGLSDPEVYKKANIDRKHFSKIRSNVDYMPSKRTALALAIALELNLDETRDLLSRAGLALSPSIISDRIIEFCIETKNYNIHDINCILFDYDQPTLGA